MKKIVLLLVCLSFYVIGQAQVSKTVNVTAGGLYSALTSTELATVTNLTITGTIDARDFVTMRDNMPALAVVDISAVTIAAYNGSGGTYGGTSYPANTMPKYSFNNPNTNQGKTTLTTILLPSSVTSIGYAAFANCSGLISVTIPSSVTSIGGVAFYYCSGLTSIYAYPTVPVNLSSSPSVFDGVNTSTCTLYVPKGSLSAYQAANQWSAFTHIVEMTKTAQVNVTAGGLSTALTSTELATVTNLTVTGTIDARDFVTMRDHMPALAVVDISAVNIAAYNGSGGTYGGTSYPANTIPENSFNNPNDGNGKTTLISILLPSSVTSIGGWAFGNCSGLTSVTIPNSVTSIGGGAFDGCISLTSVTIPNSVTSIGSQAFAGCSSLTSVTIGNSVTSIGDDAFLGCSALITVDANNPNYSSKDGILFDKNQTTLIQCPISIKGSYAIPNSVTSIGSLAFDGCISLSSISIPSSVTSIGSGAFGNCSGLTSVTIGNSVTSIGSQAFSGCTGLTSVTIPSSVTSIRNAAFEGCSALITVDANNPNYSSKDGILFDKNQTTLIQCPISIKGSYIIPSSVTSIASDAFCNCRSLTSVTIPSSVTSIGDYAFAFCSALITVDANNPNYSSKDGILFDKKQTTLIQCPISIKGSYAIPNSVTFIGTSAFAYCSSLTSVSIPSSVTSIGSDAFSGCSGLTSITIPSSVTSIGGVAFIDCSGLTSIYAYPTVPVNLSSSPSVFGGVNANTCTLYVPKGSLSSYQAANQWSAFTHIVEMTNTAVSTATVQPLFVYPNPVTDGFYIKGLKEKGTLSLFDINGKMLLTKPVSDNEYIPISTIPKGLYIVKITTAAGTMEQKVVKE